MKISIIVPIYKGSKELRLFLNDLKKQSSKSFEIILVIDSNDDDMLSVVDEFWTFFKDQIKVIYNSKRNSRSSSIRKGVSVAEGAYSIIWTIKNKFNDNMIEDMIEVSKEKDADIIEFPSKFISPIRFSGKIRLLADKKILINENKEIFALTYPFDFNKIFKTKILLLGTQQKFPININSRYSIKEVYGSMFVAKTYATTSKNLVINKGVISINFNPMKIIKQWDKMVDYFLLEKDYFIYAQYFFEVIFMSIFIKKTRNKVLREKFKKEFTKQQTHVFLKIFDKSNLVGLVKQEKQILMQNTSFSELSKSYKILDKKVLNEKK